MQYSFIFTCFTFHYIYATCTRSITLPHTVYVHLHDHARSSCGRADRLMDSHTTGPGLKTWWVRYTFYQASDWLPPHQHHEVERLLVYVEGRGRIFGLGLTQDIKMGSCVFHCDTPHQWISQRQNGPVSAYYY